MDSNTNTEKTTYTSQHGKNNALSATPRKTLKQQHGEKYNEEKTKKTTQVL